MDKEFQIAQFGLKDHQIAQLVNAIRDGLWADLGGVKFPECLRQIISRAVVTYLESQGLRRDYEL